MSKVSDTIGNTSDDDTAAFHVQEAHNSMKTTHEKVYPAWHDFVAGGVAGAGARIATHPLDLIRIRRQLGSSTTQQQPPSQNENLFQAMQSVIRNEGGITALFRGNTPAVVLWIGYTAIQFSIYERTKLQLQMLSQNAAASKFLSTDTLHTILDDENVVTNTAAAANSSSAVITFVAGALAGTAATIGTYPFDLARTIFAAAGKNHHPQSPNSMDEFVHSLYQQRGIRGFFAGMTPAILQIIPYMGLNFTIYEQIVRMDDQKSVPLSGYAGSIAGATSKAFVYPMDTIKKRMQAQGYFYWVHCSSKQQPYQKSIGECMRSIYQKEGIIAFYRGLFPSMLKSSLATGLSFAIFRFTKNGLEAIHDTTHGTPK